MCPGCQRLMSRSVSWLSEADVQVCVLAVRG
jgi:hypothetical protein